MSDRFQPISMKQLAAWIAAELETNHAIFGIPRKAFYQPAADAVLQTEVYGKLMDTPFGIAAGPHSQMAQNIIVAWLCGARFIELKTVQTLDELDVPKPCIDMQDEGYNVEWSQELKVHESFEQYLGAWVLIHALHRRLGWEGDVPKIIFNMSVGYNLEGIQKPNVQWFLKNMKNASEPLARCVEEIAGHFPEVRDVPISPHISDNVTLSTMHGCPPDEIGRISDYLMTEWHLHTSVKLNPTLLGPARLREILSERLGYGEIVVPDEAFEHDLKWADARELLKDLRQTASDQNLQFGVKLSNTLEVENNRAVFNPNEKHMYLSGQPLQGITVNLAALVSETFNGELMMSYAGGAEAFNVANLLASGMKTITTCSDILKSGGYMRMLQYMEYADRAIKDVQANDIEEFICKRAGKGTDPAEAALGNLKRYAEDVLNDPLIKKGTVDRSHTKTARKLGLFDCVDAPCVDFCPIDQKVPEYMHFVREGRIREAVDVTREDNPLARILGRACNHECENFCIRTHYETPLAIREIKRYIMDHADKVQSASKPSFDRPPVAIIGGGPCGLTAAHFLALAGYPVTIFEARGQLAGMVSGTIPGYRANREQIQLDLADILSLGVEVRLNSAAGKDFKLSDLREEGFKYIVVSVGAQKDMRLGLDGEDSAGVFAALDFLRAARGGNAPKLGKRIGVIGGGDVAMDCARTAKRLAPESEVLVIYRRTVQQMPAEPEELHGLQEEGIPIIELASPLSLKTRQGRLESMECQRMQLGEPDTSGRRRPVPLPGETFVQPLNSLLVAIGQQPDFSFFEGAGIELDRKGYIKGDADTLESSIPGLYAGGDAALDGPATIVAAAGDGHRIANAIRYKEEGCPIPLRSVKPLGQAEAEEYQELVIKRSRRVSRVSIPHLPLDERDNFDEIISTLTDQAAREEASRCLDCNRMCSLCVSVCPNKAILTYFMDPFRAQVCDLYCEDGKIQRKNDRAFCVNQGIQVAVVTDFCNECGNCTTFCPTSGEPYRDKPRIYFNRDEFLDQEDNAFMIFRDEDKPSIIEGRFGGETVRLTLGEALTCSNGAIEATLDPQTLGVLDARVLSGSDGARLPLANVATAYLLLKGLTGSCGFLPFSRAD